MSTTTTGSSVENERCAYRSIRGVLSVAFVLGALAGCGGSGGGGSGGTPNGAPTANDQSVTTPEDNARAIMLTGADPDGDAITFAVASGPSNGSLSGTAPDLTYTPNSNYNGSDSFTFTVSDGSLTSAAATVSITVDPINDPPVANDNTYTVNQSGETLPVPAPGVLGNDTDPDVQTTLTVAVADRGTRSLPHGTLTLNADGSFTYTHNGDTATTDSFTYRANDGSLNSTNAPTVTLITNQTPTANNACVSSPSGYIAGNPISGTLPGSDPESGSLTFAIANASLGGKGNATTDSAGNFSYMPNKAGIRGMDKFTYTVTDDQGLEATGAVSVFIGGPGNFPPPALRIMPLGDSITQGVTVAGGCSGGSNCPPDAERIAYRKKLYDDLEALSPNYAVQMVGTLANGEAVGLTPPNDRHEGHPGWCAGPNGSDSTYCGTRSIADNVESWLNQNPPDVILLHAGTNKFVTDASDMSALLTAIDTWQAANYPVTVFLARIIENVSGTDPVQLFNDNVAAIESNHNRVIMVNQQTGAGIVYTIGVDMGDDIHPNANGYDKMAAKWLADMTNYVGPEFIGLPSCP